ncbi:MAG: ABC transporter permease [Candidatus Thermoplasmatota archaeon]|jgi:ABC-type transport system involved in multi-copper enzyme maturation permease subunit|nr:ABC transporter permease [Candidatus Thermoplasmatota archaeon]
MSRTIFRILFSRRRLIALIIVVALLISSLSIFQVSSSAKSLKEYPFSGTAYYYNNGTYHIINIYFDQYGQPMEGAKVKNMIKAANGDYIKNLTTTININGYSVVNYTPTDPAMNMVLATRVQKMFPVPPDASNSSMYYVWRQINESRYFYSNHQNASQIDFDMWPYISIGYFYSNNTISLNDTIKMDNFSLNFYFPVYSRFSYEASLVFFYYNSNGYKHSHFTIGYQVISDTAFSNLYSVKVNFTNYVLLTPDYSRVFQYVNRHASNFSQEGGYVYMDLFVYSTFFPPYDGPGLSSLWGDPFYKQVGRNFIGALDPTEPYLFSSSMSIFINFPLIFLSISAIMGEILIFGLPRSSGSIDLITSRSRSRMSVILNRMLAGLLLFLIPMAVSIITFIIGAHYYTGLYLNPLNTLIILSSMAMVAGSLMFLSFLVASRTRSTVANIVAPLSIFFLLFYILHQLLGSLYSSLLAFGINLNHTALEAITLADPFNVVYSIAGSITNNPYIELGGTLTSGNMPILVPINLAISTTVLVLWVAVPLIAALVIWRRSE